MIRYFRRNAMWTKPSFCFLVLYLFKGVALAQPVKVVPPQNKILESSGGRYVFGQISKYRRDQYMLDTKTGRLWNIAENDKKQSWLQIVPYGNVNGRMSVIPGDIKK